MNARTGVCGVCELVRHRLHLHSLLRHSSVNLFESPFVVFWQNLLKFQIRSEPSGLLFESPLLLLPLHFLILLRPTVLSPRS